MTPGEYPIAEGYTLVIACNGQWVEDAGHRFVPFHHLPATVRVSYRDKLEELKRDNR